MYSESVLTMMPGITVDVRTLLLVRTVTLPPWEGPFTLNSRVNS